MDSLKKYNPQFSHINDTIAFVVHLSFLNSGCKLVGLRNKQYLEDIGSFPQGWNESSDLYVFRYALKNSENTNESNNNYYNLSNEKKKQESKLKTKTTRKDTYLVKILELDGNEMMIAAFEQGSNSNNEVQTFDIRISDHIRVSGDLSNYSSIFKDISGLLSLIESQITSKIVPKINNKLKNESKSKKKTSNNPNPYQNPLIMNAAAVNPRPNPLMIGGGIRPLPMGGGFNGDLDPFSARGGNLYGPNQFNRPHMGGDSSEIRPPLVPDGARFDPFGAGGLAPNPNHFPPTGNDRGRGGIDGGNELHFL